MIIVTLNPAINDIRASFDRGVYVIALEPRDLSPMSCYHWDQHSQLRPNSCYMPPFITLVLNLYLRSRKLLVREI